MSQSRSTFYEIDEDFESLWYKSGVEEVYLNLVKDKIDFIIDNLNTYDPEFLSPFEFRASLEMLAYTTTELLAQLCSGGFRWNTTDKARFLSPTVDIETIIRDHVRMLEYRGVGEYYDSIKMGVWEFLEVSEDTHSWLEALKLKRAQIAYLLWSAYKSLQLLHSEERIPGFTPIALTNDIVLESFCKCESPIESILFMQLIVDGLFPPILRSQYRIGPYRVDFAIPEGRVVLECDGLKYHKSLADAERDSDLRQMDWVVLRFSGSEILFSPMNCSSRVRHEYRW